MQRALIIGVVMFALKPIPLCSLRCLQLGMILVLRSFWTSAFSRHLKYLVLFLIYQFILFCFAVYYLFGSVMICIPLILSCMQSDHRIQIVQIISAMAMHKTVTDCISIMPFSFGFFVCTLCIHTQIHTHKTTFEKKWLSEKEVGCR